MWCAFQQCDLPASSRYGLRGEFLWGGLNSSLSSFPPPLPSILAEHKQLAGLCATCTTCLPQCCSQVTISRGQRLRGIVERRLLCVPVVSMVHTHTSMGSGAQQCSWEKVKKSNGELSCLYEEGGYHPEQDKLWLHKDMFLVCLL